MVIAPTIQIVVGTIILLILGVLSIRVRAIDVSGTIAGILISFVILLAGGLGWLFIIVSFVLISSALTKFRFDYKQKIGSAQEKGGQRSWQNTLANGLVGGVAAALEITTHEPVYELVYLSSIAGAMSDTIATEIGLLSNSQPHLITSLKVAVKGTSGAVSPLGELAGLFSAIGLGALGVLLGVVSGSQTHLVFAFISVVCAAFLSMNFDSLLGATLQGRNKCTVCGKETENLRHHGVPTMTEKGLRILDNNTVNFTATLMAGLISVALYLALIS